MIKINTSGFEWETINNIYRDAPNDLIKPLKSKIDLKYTDAATHPIVKTLLAQWFFDNGNISESKISEYLLHEEPIEKIQQFDNIISSILPSTDRAFISVISTWPVVKQKTLELKSAQERKMAVTAVITPANIHMFTGIALNDLTNTLPKLKFRVQIFELDAGVLSRKLPINRF